MTLAQRRAGTLPRVISIITLAAFLPSSFGCTSWRAVPIRQVQFDKDKLVNKRVRFYLRHDATTYNVDYHVVEMVVEEIAFPIVRGIQDVSGGTEHLSWSERRPGTEVRSVSVDLGDVSAVEIWSGEGWRPGPFTQARTEAQRLVGERARFYLRLEAATYDINRGVVEMVVREVDFPIVRGNRVHPQGKDRSNANAPSEAASIDSVSVNLIDVSRVAVWQADDHWRSCFIILGVTAAIFAILFIVAMATKESCPIVYVEGEGGYQLVGEAYAGAVFRSIQRPDLLPLPQFPTGHASLILANEARETQYTDLIELVVADHAPGTRAVSTEDQEIMLVSDAAPPLRAVDFQDEDVTTQVTTSDDDVWQTDLSQFVDAAAPPLLESLVATFPRPRAGERPVLELVVANTYYYDVVFGRFFALMGGDLGKYIEQGNRPDSGPRIARWREREGVDLLVEWKRGETWERVASVPSVGPVSLRRVAVPLPPVSNDDEADAITVRVTGGIGFWRFDEMGLSVAREGALRIRHIVPVVAQNARGEDERSVLASIDGRYQVLEEMNERLRIEFDVPPTPEGQVRSAFFYTSGYYNVHPPIQSERSLFTLKRIREEEGSFARFGLDLYREYYESAVASGVSPIREPEAP